LLKTNRKPRIFVFSNNSFGLFLHSEMLLSLKKKTNLGTRNICLSNEFSCIGRVLYFEIILFYKNKWRNQKYLFFKINNFGAVALQWNSYWIFLKKMKTEISVVWFLFGNSPASEFHMPTFRNNLFHLHRQVGVCGMN
jgi:hypothetical protein